MNEKHNIDDLFQKGVGGFQVEPSPEVWQGIEGQFFGKRKLFGWYFAGAAILLLLLAGGTYWFLGVSDTDNINSIETDFTNESTDRDLQEQTITIADSKNNNNPKENNNVSKTNETNLNSVDQSSINTKAAETNDEIDLENESSDNTADYLQNKETFIGTEPQNSIKEEELVQLNNENPSTNAPGIIITSNDNPEMLFFGGLRQNIYTMVPLQTSIEYDVEMQMIDPEKVVGLKTYLEKQKNSHVYTAATATVGMIYYPSTKDQFTWSADLALGITSKKFYFETGVGYAEINEEGVYLIDLQSYDSVGYFNEVESFEVDPNNPDEIIYNTKKVTVYDSIDHSTLNSPTFKYTYLNIPAVVGYKFFDKDEFSASIQTGLIFSMMLSKEIPTANTDFPGYTVVETRNVTPQRVDWNVRWQLGIRLNYRIKKSLSIAAEPVFTKYLNSIYDTQAGYSNVKPYTMGVKFGLYYGF